MKGESDHKTAYSTIMADTGKILITGTTGNVGSAVLDNLAATDVNLRALAHDEAKAQSLRDRGVEAIYEMGCRESRHK